MQRVLPSLRVQDKPQILLDKLSEPAIAGLTGLDALPVALTFVDFDGTDQIEIWTQGGDDRAGIDLTRDAIPLNSAIGFLSTCEDSKAAAGAFREHAAKAAGWLGTLPSADVDLEKDGREAVLEGILALLASERHRLMARNAALSTRAATSRRQFEHVQRTLTEMSNVLRTVTPENIVTLIEYLPLKSSKSHLEAPHFGRVTCEQRLPVALRGLAGVELFADKPMTTSGTIVAKLLSAEDRHVHATWTIDVGTLKTDTVRLMLPRALDTLELTPVLSLSADASLLRIFRLGAPHPDPVYCCGFGRGFKLSAPLAMRLRGSLPGRPLAFDASAIVPSTAGGEEEGSQTASGSGVRMLADLHSIVLDGPAAPSVRALDSKALAQVRQLSEVPPDVTFGVVYYWPEKSGVMVHPLLNSTTVAVFPEALSGAFKSVTAWIDAVRGDGPPVEVAIAAGNDDQMMRRILEGEVHDGSALLSGWTLIEPGRSARLQLFKSVAAATGSNLYVASRLGPGAKSHEGAWVVLRSVHAG